MKILAIETSCDETSGAIVSADRHQVKVLSNIVSSQVKLHARWGGVVPNLAAREHVRNIIPIIKRALAEAKVTHHDVDLIAVANGPGLIPALLIGTSAAKTLAHFWNKPLLSIHHIEGHIYSNFLDKRPGDIKFPALALVISGGHTQLVFMKDHLDYRIIGETQDDAVGEAFDKVARILKLGYPGGPAISQEAEKYSIRKSKTQDYGLVLPRPMIKSQDLNFSFSGLKTAVLYLTQKKSELLKKKRFVQELSWEFQNAVCEVLIIKTLWAIKKYNPDSVVLAGGVSANQEIRIRLEKILREKFPQINYFVPEMKYTGDNAAMIGGAAFFRFQKMKGDPTKNKKWKENWKKMEADANLKLK